MSLPVGNAHHLRAVGSADEHTDTSSQHSSAIHNDSTTHHTTGHHDAIDHHNTTNQLRRLTNGSFSGSADPFAKSGDYYGPDGPAARREPKNRTQSQIIPSGSHPLVELPVQPRRGSVDEQGQRIFQINDVEAMYRRLLRQEDTDGNGQITVEDSGPKV